MNTRRDVYEYLSQVLSCQKNQYSGERDNMNKVVLTGHVAQDPEISYDENVIGHIICRYSLIVDRNFHTDFESDSDLINCVTYSGWAEIVENKLKKGVLVTVVGELHVNSYPDKRGRNRKKMEVVTTEHHLITDDYEKKSKSKKRHWVSRQQNQPVQQVEAPSECPFCEIDDDDLPF